MEGDFERQAGLIDVRRRPPATRRSITHRFAILASGEAIDGYITVGPYEDGNPAELFLVLAKSGEALAGLARCWATCFSLFLQMGLPNETLIEKFKFFRFEPAGPTDNAEIPLAQSIPDYVCRWIERPFMKTPATTKS